MPKIERLKEVAQADDAAAIKEAMSDFEQSMQKLSEKLYQQPGGEQTAGAGAGASGKKGSGGGSGDEDIKDADFEVKND